jgi:curved DNA-binding protein CbpA
VASRDAIDPYAVLGVPRGASALQVARAHRRLAKRFHPDLHPGEELTDRMRHVNEAWHLLSNPVRRAAYDRDHPQGPAIGALSHWGASRRPIQPAQPSTTRTWATWRASAAETAAAPRTRRAPGEFVVPPTRRPLPMEPTSRTFRDSGWAAILVAALLLLLLAAVIVAGKIA